MAIWKNSDLSHFNLGIFIATKKLKIFPWKHKFYVKIILFFIINETFTVMFLYTYSIQIKELLENM